MTFSVTFKLDTSKLDAIVGGMEDKATKIVDHDTDLMLEKMKRDVPVDTGALRDSLTKEMEGMTATIHDGVKYGVYQELGTSKMAAQPFFFESVEFFMVRFFNDMKALFDYRGVFK